MKFSEGVRLSQDSFSGCDVIRGFVHRVCLAPRFLNGEIKTGIREDLKNQLGRYNDELDGIVLAYSNIKITQKNPVLLYDNVDMHFVVQYDVVIFRAVPGTLLKCKINDVSTNHLSCLIHETVNIAVALPEVNFDLHDPKGLDVICRVKKVEYKKGMLGLSAELTEESLKTLQEFYTESCDGYPENPSPLWESSLDKSSASNSQESKEGHDLKAEGTSEEMGDAGGTLTETDKTKRRKKKDKKRKRTKEEGLSLSSVEDSIKVDGLIKTGEKRKHTNEERYEKTEIDLSISAQDLPSPDQLKHTAKQKKGLSVIEYDLPSPDQLKQGAKRKRKKELPVIGHNLPSPKKLNHTAEQKKGVFVIEHDLPSPDLLKQEGKQKKKVFPVIEHDLPSPDLLKPEVKRKKKEFPVIEHDLPSPDQLKQEAKRKKKEFPVIENDLPSPDKLKFMVKKKKKNRKQKQDKPSSVEDLDSSLDNESSGKTHHKRKKRKHSTSD